MTRSDHEIVRQNGIGPIREMTEKLFAMCQELKRLRRKPENVNRPPEEGLS